MKRNFFYETETEQNLCWPPKFLKQPKSVVQELYLLVSTIWISFRPITTFDQLELVVDNWNTFWAYSLSMSSIPSVKILMQRISLILFCD